MEYTKGDWILKPAVLGHPHFNIMDSKETSVIAHIPSQLKEFEANAHLIAAAPDMYEALKLLRGYSEMVDNALSKAEGK